jgi:hypothetical protein
MLSLNFLVLNIIYLYYIFIFIFMSNFYEVVGVKFSQLRNNKQDRYYIKTAHGVSVIMSVATEPIQASMRARHPITRNTNTYMREV